MTLELSKYLRLPQRWNVWKNFHSIRHHSVEAVKGNDSEEPMLEQKSVLTKVATETEDRVKTMHEAVSWYANGEDPCPKVKVSLCK